MCVSEGILQIQSHISDLKFARQTKQMMIRTLITDEVISQLTIMIPLLNVLYAIKLSE